MVATTAVWASGMKRCETHDMLKTKEHRERYGDTDPDTGPVGRPALHEDVDSRPEGA
jgi:hypothetical protein